MEVQIMAPPVANLVAPHHGGGGATGCCHDVCKHGGTHEFEEKEPHKKKKKKPRKQQQQHPAAESQSRVMLKVRSVFRRRAEDSSSAAKTSAVAGKAMGGDEADTIEWKDIVAYDNTVRPLPPHGSPPQPDNKISAPVATSGDAEKKKDVNDEKKPYHQATITGQADGEETEAQGESLDKKANTADVTKSVKPPSLTTQTSLQPLRKPSFQPVGGVIWIIGKKKKKPVSLLVEKTVTMDQEALHGYEILSPSLMQSRATLLHDLEEEMVHGAATVAAEEAEMAKPPCSLDEEEYAAVVAAETSRPIPSHRRVKSMSISSRSVWYPITRQASKNSAVTFKLRSRSTKVPIAPPEEEEKPATAEESEMAKPPCSLDEEEYAAVVAAETSRPMPSHRRVKSMSISNQSVRYPITRQASKNSAVTSASTGGRGIQLRIRSLRRRGLGGVDGGVFVMPAVALRHQKTLEKKKSQMLYNDVIEETTSKLVKTRKSKVKALVGAFESVINKIAK